ncbi:MAG: DUF1538 domain-containing protein [Eubacteriales bacterium]|nr:DUF1538 domain-containing protein [Eubacteriales bacterium]MDD3199172.1 DUF1538 domain-containing protein [Eubacteriales bacterium]MDD4629173.1 DUF1538 domain-containing protein [Eubacteriales bacterium]
MKNQFILKTKESLISVLPITFIVLLINFTIAPMPLVIRGLFLLGAILLILGMGLFTLGADMALMPMGEQIGSVLTKSRKLYFLIGISLIMGIMVTVAEPDLQVLAEQVPTIPNHIIILAVAAGLGVFLVLAILRIIFQWRLSYLLIGLYIAVFILSAFVPEDFVAIAFGSGGVTTGPITVPFILALGIGISSVRGGKSSHDDSFGLVALCSVGPILAVMLLGIFYDTSHMQTAKSLPDAKNLLDLFRLFGESFPEYFKVVGLALMPIVGSFILFQIFALKLPKIKLVKMVIGSIYTYLGLVLFLTGVNVGFLPAGSFIGASIGELDYNWILIPLGMIMGFFIVAAEPAVHVLNDEVEDMTAGAISKNSMLLSLSIGVAISVGFAMIQVLTGIDIFYILIPGYIIALALTFFVPKIFTAIAFDSGGVASGPMTVVFLLPFTMGACKAVDGNILRDSFGVVAIVAMAPLITIQVMGLIHEIKIKYTSKEEAEVFEEITEEMEDKEIIALYNRLYDKPESYLRTDDFGYIDNKKSSSDLFGEKHYNDVTNDNEYINFEDYEKMVLPEDFDYPVNKPENER